MPPANFGIETTAEEAGDYYTQQIRDKFILITGASPGGLGAYFAEAVSKHQPRLLILAGRDSSKIELTQAAIAKVAPDVKTRALILDTSSLQKVKASAAEVNAYEESIDILVNNAAIMGCPYGTTEDGLEQQFGTNHIGPFLFTNLILNKILASGPGARVINVASGSHRFSPIKFDDLGFSEGKTYHKWKAYGQSKTANILFTVELAERLGKKGLLSFTFHPGVIWTNLTRFVDKSDIAAVRDLDVEMRNVTEATEGLIVKTLSQGASTYFVAAFDKDITSASGTYLFNCQLTPERVRPYAVDKENAKRLWKLSEEIVGQEFKYE